MMKDYLQNAVNKLWWSFKFWKLYYIRRNKKLIQDLEIGDFMNYDLSSKIWVEMQLLYYTVILNLGFKRFVERKYCK